MIRLSALPPVRVPEVREGRTITTGRSSNIEAFLAQMVGTEYVADPCNHCASGSGVFTQCVTVNGLFAASCANCHYGSEGARCSFRKLHMMMGLYRNLRSAGAPTVVDVGYSDRSSSVPAPVPAPVRRRRRNGKCKVPNSAVHVLTDRSWHVFRSV